MQQPFERRQNIEVAITRPRLVEAAEAVDQPTLRMIIWRNSLFSQGLKMMRDGKGGEISQEVKGNL
jgi:hypothetical protein